MGHLSETASWNKITKKVVVYLIPLFLIYLIFIFISNEMVFHNHHYPSVQLFCKSRSFRFFFRELEVYTFAYLGYKFIQKEINISWSKLYLITVFCIDFIVSCIGAYRYFVKDSDIADLIYNQLLVFIASPFYFLIFTIFAIYLRPGIELRNNEFQD